MEAAEIIELAKKKFIEDNNELEKVLVNTNLNELKLDEKAIKDVHLFGCEIKQEYPVITDFNKVYEMRKARKIKEFQEEVKKHVPNYYISGLVLLGKPKDLDEKNFSFYILFQEDENRKIVSSKILTEPKPSQDLPEKIKEKILCFEFTRKISLSEKYEKSKSDSSVFCFSQCISSYLNICLGKLLKKCDYTKDRSTRKILYYKKEEVFNAQPINRKNKGALLFFPALKAVCETYDQGKIFLRLLPKRILKTRYTYLDLFDYIIRKYDKNQFNEGFNDFKSQIINKRGIKSYNQEILKIDDVIFENPYILKFMDKDNNERKVGEYLTEHYGVEIPEKKQPIIIRYIDYNGKLKGDERKKVCVPSSLMETVGNLFNDPINVRDLVQSPSAKYDEIENIRNEIEYIRNNKEKYSEEDKKEGELLNYLGNKFIPVEVDGHVILAPMIKFGNNYDRYARNDGTFEMLKTDPFSKNKELSKVDIYLLGIGDREGSFIWNNLIEASKELGITIKCEPEIYTMDVQDKKNDSEEYFNMFFQGLNEKYSDKKKLIDCMFLFMDSKFKNARFYKYFKSTINKFDWKFPSQVILYDQRKLDKGGLSQFTNILCQIWAKRGDELYCCDFSFIPKTIIIAYSSMMIRKGEDNYILTSLCISIGFKLFEYLFYSDVSDVAIGHRVSPSVNNMITKALASVGKFLKNDVDNIIIYREGVNEKQMKSVQEVEIRHIQNAIDKANQKLDDKKLFSNTKWCFIMVSKFNDIKLFMKNYCNKDYGDWNMKNVPVGTIIDKKITSQEKYDFYLNSADSRQGTCSPTHYTVLFDNTQISANNIYKTTYFLTFLCYNTTKSIKVPAPLYFVTRRNNFIRDNLKPGDVINPKLRTFNISL